MVGPREKSFTLEHAEHGPILLNGLGFVMGIHVSDHAVGEKLPDLENGRFVFRDDSSKLNRVYRGVSNVLKRELQAWVKKEHSDRVLPLATGVPVDPPPTRGVLPRLPPRIKRRRKE